MPATITHKEHATEVYERLPIDIQELVSINHMQVFAQSHDYLYHFQSLNKQENQAIHKLGHTAHSSNTQNYLINIVRNIKELKLENDPEAIAYLYGSICHFALDSKAHPFVFYKTGTYHNTKETEKYHGMHTLMETELDAYIYNKNYHKDLKNIKTTKEVIPNITIKQSTYNLINLSYQKSFNKNNIAHYYLKGISHAQIKLRFLCQDRTGLKKQLYKLISKIIYHNSTVLSAYSYHIKEINPNYLNLDHQTWHHPCNNEPSTKSFDDLYEEAVMFALKMIKAVNSILYERSSYTDLSKSIPNISYTTGLPINTENKPLQFFEY